MEPFSAGKYFLCSGRIYGPHTSGGAGIVFRFLTSIVIPNSHCQLRENYCGVTEYSTINTSQ
jgi:hypothetical protein